MNNGRCHEELMIVDSLSSISRRQKENQVYFAALREELEAGGLPGCCMTCR
jgi:hypothetical protein